LAPADDEFIYELVVVGSGEEAVIAARLNANLQACVIRRRFAHTTARDLSGLAHFTDRGLGDELAGKVPEECAQILARALARLRPELDLYLMTEVAVEDMAGRLSHHFRRVFHAREGSLELHLSILRGIADRYQAPFFEALRDYSHRPTGAFHALPISARPVCGSRIAPNPIRLTVRSPSVQVPAAVAVICAEVMITQLTQRSFRNGHVPGSGGCATRNRASHPGPQASRRVITTAATSRMAAGQASRTSSDSAGASRPACGCSATTW
jgi:hypothetical protein